MRPPLDLKKLSVKEFKSLWEFKHKLVLSSSISGTIFLFHIMLDQVLMAFPSVSSMVILYEIGRRDLCVYREAMVWEYLPPRKKTDLVLSLRKIVAIPGFLYLYRTLYPVTSFE